MYSHGWDRTMLPLQNQSYPNEMDLPRLNVCVLEQVERPVPVVIPLTEGVLDKDGKWG
jgi:hypothetical protein